MPRNSIPVSGFTVCAGVTVFGLTIFLGLLSIVLAVVQSENWCPGCVEEDFDSPEHLEDAPHLPVR